MNSLNARRARLSLFVLAALLVASCGKDDPTEEPADTAVGDTEAADTNLADTETDTPPDVTPDVMPDTEVADSDDEVDADPESEVEAFIAVCEQGQVFGCETVFGLDCWDDMATERGMAARMGPEDDPALSLEACLAYGAGSCAYFRVVESLTEGYQSFDAERSRACQADLEAMTCEELVALPEDSTCFFLTGNQDTGERCITDDDCAQPGDRCAGYWSGAPTCQTPNAGAGDPCDTRTVCEVGLVCGSTPDGSATVCEAPRGEGEYCLDYRECSVELQCLGALCSPYTEEGGTCASHWECEDGLYCYIDTCTRAE